MFRNASSVAGVGEHHGLLHSPCVIAAHKTTESVVTVFATGGVRGIYWFALDEQGVIFRKHSTPFPLIVAEVETQIGRLRDPCPIEVCHLGLAHHGVVSVTVETATLPDCRRLLSITVLIAAVTSSSEAAVS